MNKKHYIITLLIAFVFLISIPLCFNKIILPSFERQIYDTLSDQAKRIAYHISTTIDFKGTPLAELNRIVDLDLYEFKIYKLHFFDKDGTVLYSTVPEKVGTVNTHDYFHNIVAKGEVYFTIKYANEFSSEEEQVKTDIIEIYIPIMIDGEFIQAFEVYYDISEEIKKFNELATRVLILTIALSLFGFIALISVLNMLRTKNKEISFYKRRIQELKQADSKE